MIIVVSRRAAWEVGAVRELSVAEQRYQAVLLSTHPVPASSRGQYCAYADAVRARSRGGYCASRLEVGYQEWARAGLPVESSDR
jgi:hypothetical protein